MHLMSPPQVHATAHSGLWQESDALHAKIEPIFDKALEQMFTLLEDLDRQQTALSRLAEKIGGKEIEEIATIAKILDDTVESLHDQAAKRRSVSDAFSPLVQKIRGHLSSLRRKAKMASMVAMNAQVASASIPREAGSLDIFASEMRQLLGGLDASVATIETSITQSLDDIVIERRTAAELERQTEEQILPAVHRIATKAATTASDRNFALLARTQAENVTVFRQALGPIMNNLQCGDELRQRLEHARQVRLAAYPSGTLATGVADGLARRLIHGAAEHNLERLSAALDKLKLIARRMESMTDSEFHASLKRLARMAKTATELKEKTEALNAQNGPSDTVAESQTFDALDRATQSIVSVGELDQKLTVVGINAILMSARLGDQGRAMSAIAVQLNQITGEITSELEQLKSTVISLRKLDQTIPDSNVGFGSAMLSICLGAVQSLEDLVVDLLGDSGDAEHVIFSAPDIDINETIDSLGLLATGLRRILHQTASVPHESLPVVQDLDAQWADLETLRQTYTMSSERTIHDAFLADLTRDIP